MHRGPATREKIEEHRQVFDQLWCNFEIVAKACHANGGKIAIEWPKGCTYWKDSRVIALIERFALCSYALDGCMYGLRSVVRKTRGKFLRKPWIIMSDCDDFWRIENRCNHDRRAHVRIQGADAKLTEGYTDQMADRIHLCWECHCL